MSLSEWIAIETTTENTTDFIERLKERLRAQECQLLNLVTQNSQLQADNQQLSSLVEAYEAQPAYLNASQLLYENTKLKHSNQQFETTLKNLEAYIDEILRLHDDSAITPQNVDELINHH
jgi:chromosome segregation ATPase